MSFKWGSLSVLWLWLILFALVPFLLVLGASFLTHTEHTLITPHPSLYNYTQLITSVYARILWQSLLQAFLTTLLCLLLGYPMAFFIAQWHPTWKSLLMVLVMIPFWTSSLIRTYAILALIKTKGILNVLLLTLGWIHTPLALLYSNTAVLIGCVYNLLPFMILPLYANIEKLDHRLLEAGRDLGASRLQLFSRIILPLTTPGILAGSLLVFLPAMTLFYIPVILGGAKSLMIGNLIETQFLTLRDWPGGSATSIALTLLMLLLIAIYRRVTKDNTQREELLG
jgi:spermidine/putrescine transport system permease protein